MKPNRFRSFSSFPRGGLAPLVMTALLSVLAGCQRGDEPMPPAVTQHIRETVEVQALPASIHKQKEVTRAWEEMRRFYRARQYQPAWSDTRRPLPQAEELLRAIDMLSAEGIDPRRYQKDELAALLPEKRWKDLADDPEEQRRLADLDVQLTFTFLTMATHLTVGRLQPDTVRTDWYTKPRNVDLETLLARTLAEATEGSIERALRSVAPPSEDYARLRQALVRYQALLEKGGWPAVPAKPGLKPGARGPEVAALRARLAAESDLPPTTESAEDGAATPAASAPDAGVFDPALSQAVARFQRRHGLEVTGEVDKKTLAALNVSAAERVRQLVVNMERWRWMPTDLGQRYIWVNIPEFRMELIEGGRPALAMRIVVGKVQSRTPVFSDKMEYLEFNPYWNIPDSILSEEILPEMAGDPTYLARHNMEVIPGPKYRLRQRPGPDNPLGKVKFMFPNDFDIYLHDTPADHLFDRSERDFSHGCIRLERPIELAEYLLRDDPKWGPEAIRAKLTSGEHTTVKLPRPLPVHIVYFTGWVEKDGAVRFREDLYGHDAKLEAALVKEPPVVPLDLGAVRGQLRAAR